MMQLNLCKSPFQGFSDHKKIKPDSCATEISKILVTLALASITITLSQQPDMKQ